MPSQWTIRLDGPTDPGFPAEAPHAVVSRWLDDDHNAQAKSFSIAPPTRFGRFLVLHIRLLDDVLSGRLTEQAVVGSSVRLGRHPFTVAAPPTLVDGASWTDLASTPPARSWEVLYLSPATFRHRNRSSPWPAPASVLTGLSVRWRLLDPVTAPAPDPQTLRTVWVSDIEGRSEPFTLKQMIVSGFVGRLRYVCDGTPDQIAAVSSLFSFARYAGIGSHTAFGCGTVDVIHTRPARCDDRV
jgi:CRISPR-associated endoribonuclease Cas6